MPLTTSLHNGRTVIPAPLRAQLGLEEGDELIWEAQDGVLVVTTRWRRSASSRRPSVGMFPPASRSWTS